MGLSSLNDLLNALQKRWNFHIFHTASTLESIVLIQRLTRWVQSRPTGWLASGPIVANVRRAELPTPADDARPLRTANHTWSELIDNSRPLPPRPPANERKALVIDRDVAGEANRRTKSLQKELDPLFATLLQTFAADEAAAIQTLRTALRNMENTLNSGLAALIERSACSSSKGFTFRSGPAVAMAATVAAIAAAFLVLSATTMTTTAAVAVQLRRRRRAVSDRTHA